MLSQKTLALAKKTQEAWAEAALTKGVEPGEFVILQKGFVIHLPTESPYMQSAHTLQVFRDNLPGLVEFAKAGDWGLYCVGLRQYAIFWLSSALLHLYRAGDWRRVSKLNARKSVRTS